MRSVDFLEDLMMTHKHDFDRKVTRNPHVSMATKQQLWADLVAKLAPIASELDTARVETERQALIAFKIHERELLLQQRRNRRKGRAA